MRDYPKHELDALASFKATDKAQYQALLDIKYALEDLAKELHLSRRAQNQQVQRLDGLLDDTKSASKLAKLLRGN